VKDEIRKLLRPLTGDNAVSDLYAALLENGPQTISELSRSSGVERTKIYRSIRELEHLQLVETEILPHRNLFHAAPLTNIRNVIAEKVSVLSKLNEQVDSLEEDFKTMSLSHEATKVRFFTGPKGIEQMLWNQTKAKGDIISILSENIRSHTSREFAERWTERCNERRITSRSLVDDHFIDLQKQVYGGKMGHALDNWTARRLKPEHSTTPHRTTVYDDVTTYFSWRDGDAFGIEIHNQDIADSQRQYFELLWAQSEPLE